MITETAWLNTAELKRAVSEIDLFILTPYKNSITIMLKYGPMLVQATHDGADEGGDIEILKNLCLIRFNQGEHQ